MKNYTLKSLTKSNHHLIFEGAELTGKSFIISKIYDYLEKKYNSHPKILNGCHWFNCDVGIFGSAEGRRCIDEYIKMLEILKGKNVLFEKFHLTDMVYNKLYNNRQIDYSKQERKLKKLNAKIILFKVKNKGVFENRIQDRLNLYPHYARILQTPDDYWQQQKLYLRFIKKSQLAYLIIDSSKLPNERIIAEILSWIGER